MASYIDKTIGGYKIKKFIAKGGMGSVYYAKHPVLKERPPVAIKVLHRHLLETGNLKERFRREANLQARLRHKSLIRLLEYLEDEKDCYIIMEYFKSKSLSDIIGRQTGPMPSKRAVPIFKQVLEGIGYAHDNNIIHRDIKPSNVLVDDNDIVKITDFGIAKVVGDNSMTATGSVIGTRLYMSPEQIQGKRATKKSDIYSLGVTFYEMLAGRVPFESSNEFTVMEGHINKKPDPPTKHYPHIPENIVDSVMKAMEKKPGSRFNDCNEFIQAIRGKTKVGALSGEQTPLGMVHPRTKESITRKKEKKEIGSNAYDKSALQGWYIWGAGFIIFALFFVALNEFEGKKPVKRTTTSTRTTPTPNYTANDYYQEGMKHNDNGNWALAIKSFTNAIAIDRNYKDARFQRGWSYYNNNNYSGAISDAKYLLINDKSFANYYLRGWAYIGLDRNNSYKLAINDFTKAIDLSDGKNAYSYYGRAEANFNSAQASRSINDYNKAIELLPKNELFYHDRAWAWRELFQPDKACQDLRSSIKNGGSKNAWSSILKEYYEINCN